MGLDLQKPGIWKRLSASLFDFILICIIAVGMTAVFSIVLNFDGYNNKMTDIYNQYAEEYGIDLQITDEEFAKLDEESKNAYYEANEALQKDEKAIYTYRMIMNLALVMASLGIFVACFVWEFLIPMFLKNGQTVGKKIFGVGVMRTNGVKISNPILFIRAILGKCTIETMVPVFLLILIFFGNMGLTGIIVIVLLLALEIFVMAKTHTDSFIHDLLSDTVVVDIASQRIFETEEDLIKYKEALQRELAEKSDY